MVVMLLGLCAAPVAAQVSFERQDYPAQNDASWVVTGDFNNDGIPDLLVVNSHSCVHSCLSSTVSVLLGNGDGSFQLPISSDEGGYSAGMPAIGDFNSDGNLDVAVVGGGSSGISILLGNGDGTFQPPRWIQTDQLLPVFLTAAALRSNGPTDLVGIENNSDGSFFSTRLFVIQGNGDGTFQSPVFSDLGSNGSSESGQSLTVADLNGDGIPDIAVTVRPFCSPGCKGLVSVLLGNGDGTFQEPTRYGPLDYNTGGIVAADLMNRGIFDLAVTNAGRCPAGPDSCEGSVSVLIGNRDGSFQDPRNFRTKGCGLITVGDFNGDGDVDVALTSCNPPLNNVLLLFGDGQGGFGNPISFQVGSSPNGIAAGDFNQDGGPDLATSNMSSNVSVLINTTSH